MFRPTISFGAYNIIYAAFTAFVFNFYVLRQIAITASFGIMCAAALCLFMGLLSAQMLLFWRKTIKPLSVLLVLTNAVASYFISAYNLALNKSVIASVFDTNFVEATEWFGLYFYLWVLGFGIVPATLILWVKIAPMRFKKRALTLLGALALVGAVSACFAPYKIDVKIYLKEQFNLRYQLVPSGYISSLVSVTKRHFKKVPAVNSVAGMKYAPYWQAGKKNLIVFVLGESARDANFSLSGYKRDTGKALRPFERDLTVFHQTHSCGVVTRHAVPCMFSPYKRVDYKEEANAYTTNVLDILAKNKFNMLWLDNEMGCNKVCRNLKTEFTCDSRDCTDMALNNAFRAKLDTLTAENNFVVLHQRGSHGPRYDLRYPKEHRQWAPECARTEHQKCTPEELINAYDNSMYYSFVTVADVIETLNGLKDKYNPILIFISDHGESLGEEGVYGHNGRWEEVPAYQKEVPFFIWMPASTREAFGMDKKCLDEKTKTRQTQDVIFHSLLGLAGVSTDVCDAALDIFAGCHRAPRQ